MNNETEPALKVMVMYLRDCWILMSEISRCEKIDLNGNAYLIILENLSLYYGLNCMLP